MPVLEGHFVPFGILRGKVGVEFPEHFRFERLLEQVLNLLQRRPEILQEDVVAILVLTDRFVAHIDIHTASQGKGHHQRRRHQEIRLDELMDACLEVAVAGQHARGDQVVFDNRLVDLRMQGAGIADAGRIHP